MDAFYAAVEQRDRPELRGRPVVVGGPPQSRGVVATASYEARPFGIHSAMPCAQAYRLCPEAVFVKPDFARYKAASLAIREIFSRFTERIEPLSLDEAYLDVTENLVAEPSATRIAETIRRAISEELELTASAGVADCKFLAKVASDQNKPDGLCVITPQDAPRFLETLLVRRVPGIGPVTATRCAELGIVHCADFLRFDESELIAAFGRSGPTYRRLARGIDPRPVEASRVRKSVGIEDTFAQDLTTRQACADELQRLAAGLEDRALAAGVTGRTLTLKVRWTDFRSITRSLTREEGLVHANDILPLALALLDETQAGPRPCRLLGLQLSKLGPESPEQQLHLPFEPHE